MTQERRKIVIPSQLLGDIKEKKAGRGTFVENGKIYSEILGILQKNTEYINIIPIKGRYNPLEKDLVILGEELNDDLENYGEVNVIITGPY